MKLIWFDVTLVSSKYGEVSLQKDEADFKHGCSFLQESQTDANAQAAPLSLSVFFLSALFDKNLAD